MLESRKRCWLAVTGPLFLAWKYFSRELTNNKPLTSGDVRPLPSTT